MWAIFHKLSHHDFVTVAITTIIRKKKKIVLKTLTLRWHMSHQDYQH